MKNIPISYSKLKVTIHKILLVQLFLGFSLSLCTAQDFINCFGTDWSEAVQYANDCRNKWETVFQTFDIPSDIAEAVIFPELIRYSALKNFVETAAVKALYVKDGSSKANFSIGRFQMKPSFAEKVETEWMKSDFKREYNLYFDLNNRVEARKARILRIDDPTWQCVYLSMFFKLLYSKFEVLTSETIDNQVQFCATAYNYSFTDNYESIVSKIPSKYYHTDFLPNSETEYYSYSDIALYYYKQKMK